MRSILVDAPTMTGNPATAAAIAFRTVAPTLPKLTDAERALLGEWLARAADS